MGWGRDQPRLPGQDIEGKKEKSLREFIEQECF